MSQINHFYVFAVNQKDNEKAISDQNQRKLSSRTAMTEFHVLKMHFVIMFYGIFFLEQGVESKTIHHEQNIQKKESSIRNLTINMSMKWSVVF